LKAKNHQARKKADGKRIPAFIKKGLVLLWAALALAACSNGAKGIGESVQRTAHDQAEAFAAPSAGSAASAGATAQVTAADMAAVAPLSPGGAGWGTGTPPAVSAGSGDANAGAGGTAGGGVSDAASAGTLVAFDPGLSRKMIYTAHVTMNVDDFDAAETKLQDAIHLSGAYIVQFSNQADAEGKSARYVVKVPAGEFSSFLARLRGIEKNLQIRVEGSDVTEEYVDLEARLEAKKAAEARLLAFMEKAADADDLVRFSAELAAVQEQIEQIKGRMRYIDQNVAYSTVNIRLYENGNGAGGQGTALGKRMADAVSSSAAALGAFGRELLVFLAALLPVAAVLAVIGIPAYMLIRRRMRRTKPAQPSPGTAGPENPHSEA